MLGASPCLAQSQPKRNLSIHEYQAMDILKKHDVRVPQYQVANSADEAFKIATHFGKI